MPALRVASSSKLLFDELLFSRPCPLVYEGQLLSRQPAVAIHIQHVKQGLALGARIPEADEHTCELGYVDVAVLVQVEELKGAGHALDIAKAPKLSREAPELLITKGLELGDPIRGVRVHIVQREVGGSRLRHELR